MHWAGQKGHATIISHLASAPQSRRQTWTALQRDGPNRLGFWLIRRPSTGWTWAGWTRTGSRPVEHTPQSATYSCCLQLLLTAAAYSCCSQLRLQLQLPPTAVASRTPAIRYESRQCRAGSCHVAGVSAGRMAAITGSAPQSMQQMWTISQHDGPNRPGLPSKQATLRPSPAWSGWWRCCWSSGWRRSCGLRTRRARRKPPPPPSLQADCVALRQKHIDEREAQQVEPSRSAAPAIVHAATAGY